MHLIIRRAPGIQSAARVVAAGVVVGGLALVVASCGSSEAAACGGVEHAGTGAPDLVLVSSLPLRGPSSAVSLQINDAIRAQLKTRRFEAGRHTIGFQACDDSTAATGGSDPGRCAENASAYADGDNDRVIGVIGPLDSQCAAILIPALNQAPNGAIPIVSPTNTYPCLTRGGAGCDISEPGKYYPSGRRNYVRVAANDIVQGAAIAQFARGKGVRRVYVLHDREAYGVGMAASFRAAARSLGIEVVGFEGWNPKAATYVPLFERVRSKRADAVFLGGLIEQNGGRVIDDKVRVLGPNDGDVRLLASDGFAKRRTIDDGGSSAKGMYVASADVSASALPAAAKAFADDLAADYLGGRPLDMRAIHGAQAAVIVLDAIAKSDGTRGEVLARIFETRVIDGLLGTFAFDPNGDPTAGTGPIVEFTILRVARGFEVDEVIDPAAATVRAAQRG